MPPDSTSDVQREVAAAARKLMPEWRGVAVQVLSRLPGGYSHNNYRLRTGDNEFVLRIPRSSSRAQRAFEHQWWQSLPEGLSPQLIRYDPQTGIMLTSWLEGDLLVHMKPARNQVCRYLKRLHQQMPKAGRRYDLLALLDQWLPVDVPPAVTSAYTLFKGARRPHSGSCHNDLNAWNIICSGDRWFTIDWEMAAENDPLFDVVALAFGLGRSTRWAKQLCSDYLGEPVSNARFDANRVGFWLREYAWAENQIAEGNDRTEIIEQRLTALQRLEAEG